jgi:chromosome partitioning protein
VIYCIAMNKGGVCKTSCVTNLGAVLSGKKRVLIIDMDGQGNCCLAFGINPVGLERTIYDVLVGECSIGETMIKITKNLTLVPCSEDMNFLEFEVLQSPAKYPRPFEILAPHVAKIKNDYDYILIDTPPSMGLATYNALTASEKVIIPFEPELFSNRGLIKILETIKDFKKMNNPGLEVAGVLAVKVDSRTYLHSDLLQAARKYCCQNDTPMFDTVIPRSIRFASASNYRGKPAVWVDKKNSIVDSYRELAKEVIKNGR